MFVLHILCSGPSITVLTDGPYRGDTQPRAAQWADLPSEAKVRIEGKGTCEWRAIDAGPYGPRGIVSPGYFAVRADPGMFPTLERINPPKPW